MTAFFIAINRDRQPFDKSLAQTMMSQLDRFGDDSKQLIVGDYFAIGFQSTWCVPEEQGETQPLKLESSWFGFYGRVDNRAELIAALSEKHETIDDQVSDAWLAQHYLRVFSLSCLSDIVGPFALFQFDERSGELLLARDGMGSRHLVYQISENHVLASSYEMALLAHPSLDYIFRDDAIALYLTSHIQTHPASIIADIELIYPGHALSVDSFQRELVQACPMQNSAYTRFYKPDPRKRVLYETDQEYADEFKRLLGQAVKRRLRGIGNVGSQLSGGLDSVPVTILAAQNLSAPANDSSAKHKPTISAYSWVFDHYAEADERMISGPICEAYGLKQIKINCDHIWPDHGPQTKPDPLGPIYNPFMSFNHVLFKQAQSNSVSTMLNGIHGDLLYGYTQGILYELLARGRFRDAFLEAGRLLKTTGSWRAFTSLYLLKPVHLVNRFLSKRKSTVDSLERVLQPEVISKISRAEHYLRKESYSAIRPSQWCIVLGDFVGRDLAIGRFIESEYSIERRYPFRDRDLCEFMLAIPSDQLAFNGVLRPIVKRAFANEFPKNLRERNGKTSFAKVMREGMSNDQNNKRWGESQAQEWSRYVKECYFNGKVEQNSYFDVVKWRCGYYDYWMSVCYHPLAKKLGLGNE